ncbi:MAG: hypothetical protein Q8M18_14945 [Bradyrhizobium sp.]|nr:hypothetical protein [Bradyrhizobium sp.]
MLTLDNLIGRVPLLLRYLLAALALGGLILAMILPRAAILRSGQEVRLEIAPAIRAICFAAIMSCSPIGSARWTCRRMQRIPSGADSRSS